MTRCHNHIENEKEGTCMFFFKYLNWKVHVSGNSLPIDISFLKQNVFAIQQHTYISYLRLCFIFVGLCVILRDKDQKNICSAAMMTAKLIDHFPYIPGRPFLCGLREQQIMPNRPVIYWHNPVPSRLLFSMAPRGPALA